MSGPKTTKITLSLPHMERDYLRTVDSPSNLVAQLLNDRIRREFWADYTKNIHASPNDHRTFNEWMIDQLEKKLSSEDPPNGRS